MATRSIVIPQSVCTLWNVLRCKVRNTKLSGGESGLQWIISPNIEAVRRY